MAHPNTKLIEALRQAASRLKKGAYYEWGNHGACNCGHLLQVITELPKGEIQHYALSSTGEWTEIAEDWCPVTDAPVGLLMTKLEAAGLTPSDIHHIEYLSDESILAQLPGGKRWLERNKRDDVVLYFETMADMLEEKMIRIVKLNLETEKVTA